MSCINTDPHLPVMNMNSLAIKHCRRGFELLESDQLDEAMKEFSSATYLGDGIAEVHMG